MKYCKVCGILSHLLGKRIIMPLLGHSYPMLRRDEVTECIKGLKLELVGSLVTRGWTRNDVDVVGVRNDAVKLHERLKEKRVRHPVHYCGDRDRHSHIYCAYYGIKMALTGRADTKSVTYLGDLSIYADS